MATLARSLRLLSLLALWTLGSSLAHAAQPAPLSWHDNYQVASKQAETQGKMLLILFVNPQRPSAMAAAVETALTNDPALRKRLSQYVLAKLPTDTVIHVGGKPVTLLQHASMQEMHGREGLTIIDLAHRDQSYYGHVVSAYPFMNSKYYAFRTSYLPTILDLPPGTITQRTMIWAVRVHPERPASTLGQKSPTLVSEAESHSRYQAQVRLQGHHRWNFRFQRIRRLLGGLFAPVEVVAESWPNQTMIDSCIDCVDSWRHSPGHWNAVRSYHTSYGYDIKRGSNGIWYGTGIFAN